MKGEIMIKEIEISIKVEDIIKETGKSICGMTCSG